MKGLAGTFVAALLLASSVPLAAQKRLQGTPSAAKTVALTPGSCVRIADGDTVTLEWSPGFTHPEAMLGINKLALVFSLPGNEKRALGGSGLVLRALLTQKANAPATPAITTLPNGFFQFRFRADLRSVPAGQYHLVRVDAVPNVDPGYTGEAPQMTNSPLSSPFCLSVAGMAAQVP